MPEDVLNCADRDVPLADLAARAELLNGTREVLRFGSVCRLSGREVESDLADLTFEFATIRNDAGPQDAQHSPLGGLYPRSV
jgi:hypothetical protein